MVFLFVFHPIFIALTGQPSAASLAHLPLWLLTWALPSLPNSNISGQTAVQAPQPMQVSLSIFTTIKSPFELFRLYFYKL